jgi:hypothetical protein
VGYGYNDNPVPSVGTLFNVQSPTITQHTIAVGTTLKLIDRLSSSLGYAYGFRNTLTGPVREANGTGVSFDTAGRDSGEPATRPRQQPGEDGHDGVRGQEHGGEDDPPDRRGVSAGQQSAAAGVVPALTGYTSASGQGRA